MSTTQISISNLTSTLGCLFELEAEVSEVSTPEKIGDPRVAATFNDDLGTCRFAVVCELSLANSLGASLTMIPPGGAEDATEAGEVPENIAENLHEVMNICSSIFANQCNERIVLDQVALPGSPQADELAEKIDNGECLLQVDYNLGRYQSGKMSLLQF